MSSSDTDLEGKSLSELKKRKEKLEAQVTELKARRADRSEIRPVYEKYVKASIMVLAKDIEERKGQRYKSRSSLEKEKANLEVGIKRGQSVNLDESYLRPLKKRLAHVNQLLEESNPYSTQSGASSFDATSQTSMRSADGRSRSGDGRSFSTASYESGLASRRDDSRDHDSGHRSRRRGGGGNHSRHARTGRGGGGRRNRDDTESSEHRRHGRGGGGGSGRKGRSDKYGRSRARASVSDESSDPGRTRRKKRRHRRTARTVTSADYSSDGAGRGGGRGGGGGHRAGATDRRKNSRHVNNTTTGKTSEDMSTRRTRRRKRRRSTKGSTRRTRRTRRRRSRSWSWDSYYDSYYSGGAYSSDENMGNRSMRRWGKRHNRDDGGGAAGRRHRRYRHAHSLYSDYSSSTCYSSYYSDWGLSRGERHVIQRTLFGMASESSTVTSEFTATLGNVEGTVGRLGPYTTFRPRGKVGKKRKRRVRIRRKDRDRRSSRRVSRRSGGGASSSSDGATIVFASGAFSGGLPTLLPRGPIRRPRYGSFDGSFYGGSMGSADLGSLGSLGSLSFDFPLMPAGGVDGSLSMGADGTLYDRLGRRVGNLAGSFRNPYLV